MKKVKNILVSLVLLISIALSFASCQYVNGLIDMVKKDEEVKNDENAVVNKKPEKNEVLCSCCIRTEDGYTGGLTNLEEYHHYNEVYWLETYDEVVEAVELLKSHGTEIPPIILFDCEEYGLDMKFCISFRKSSEPYTDGKNYFDRKLEIVEIYSFVFFEDVTVEELEYSHYNYYECVLYYAHHLDISHMDYPEDPEDVYLKATDDSDGWGYIQVHYNRESQYTLWTRLSAEISAERLELLEKTMRFIKEQCEC